MGEHPPSGRRSAPARPACDLVSGLALDLASDLARGLAAGPLPPRRTGRRRSRKPGVPPAGAGPPPHFLVAEAE